MRTSPKLLPLLIAASLVVGLSGCAVSITSGEEPPAAPSAREDASEDPPAAENDAPEESEPADGDAVTREQLAAAATTTMRCDGELTILDDGVAVHVEGACDHLILNSTGSQLVTGDVALLEVVGDGNLVLTEAIGELLVNGTGNMVHWTGTTPAVSDVGEANLLKAG